MKSHDAPTAEEQLPPIPDKDRSMSWHEYWRDEVLPERERQLRSALRENRVKDAQLAMAVARLGGLVEGNPTGRHNFLQRVDELTYIEKWFGQAANLLNLYARGFCPKDVALDLLEKIALNWPDMLDGINPDASPDVESKR